MRALAATAALAIAGLVLAGCVARESPSTQPPTEDFSAAQETQAGETGTEDTGTASAEPTDGECAFRPDGSGEPAVGLPPDDGSVTASALQLAMSAGEVTVTLDAAKAPCTVQSMAFLAGQGFFDNTRCHRLTASAGLKVLQCGDPNGDGSGGPGYVIPDELPTDLAPAEDGQAVIYPRGVVAMANRGPDSGGSQFFLVYGDSTLPPNYTVFGTLDEASLAVLDQIAAGGITPKEHGPEDGAPTVPVTIETATVS